MEIGFIKCDKCRENIIDGWNLIVEGGITYFFCDDCYETAKELPTNYLGGYCRKTSEYVKDKIQKSKEKRKKGEGKWHKEVTKEHTCIWSDKWAEIIKKNEDKKV